MIDELIDHIIAARNEIAALPHWQHLRRAVDHLDRVLATIPPGQRNDVDLLLGRSNAKLPERS